jgi:hypothetical protein
VFENANGFFSKAIPPTGADQLHKDDPNGPPSDYPDFPGLVRTSAVVTGSVTGTQGGAALAAEHTTATVSCTLTKRYGVETRWHVLAGVSCDFDSNDAFIDVSGVSGGLPARDGFIVDGGFSSATQVTITHTVAYGTAATLRINGAKALKLAGVKALSHWEATDGQTISQTADFASDPVDMVFVEP